MKNTIVCILTLLPACCAAQPQPEAKAGQLIAPNRLRSQAQGRRRFRLLEQLNERRDEVPLVYYTYSASYVANSPEKFLRPVPAELILSNERSAFTVPGSGWTTRAFTR